MRIQRGYLFWGIVFVLLGGIPLAERAGLIEVAQLGDVGRLWPVALIALGLAIVVARSGIALVGTIVAGLIVGGFLGSTLAVGNGWFLDFGGCTTSGDDLSRTTRSGTFTGPARVELTLSCGTLDVQAGVTTTALESWALDARHRGDPPVITESGTALSVKASEASARRQEWTLFLPRPDVSAIEIVANAATANVDVTGATLSGLDIQTNAGEVKVLAADAAIADLAVQVNAGRARITLGDDTGGSIGVNAGTIDLCVPPDATLTLDVADTFAFATNLTERGLSENGNTWTRAGTGTGPTIDLSIEGNAGTFTLDPSGGCA